MRRREGMIMMDKYESDLIFILLKDDGKIFEN